MRYSRNKVETIGCFDVRALVTQPCQWPTTGPEEDIYMNKTTFKLVGVTLVAASLALAGCGSRGEAPGPAPRRRGAAPRCRGCLCTW